MSADQGAVLDTVLLALSIARDDLCRIEHFARRMQLENRGHDRIATALRAEIIGVKRMLNSAQIAAGEIVMARDQIELPL